jgi:hypothetical protein
VGAHHVFRKGEERMKKVMAICAALCLVLSLASVSWAGPVVSPPPGAPSWWNAECIYYAYAWWEVNITGGQVIVSPPNDPAHWASNFLDPNAFTASIGVTNETIAVDLDNVYRPDLYKEIYIYISGTALSTVDPVNSNLDTDSGKFYGSQTWTIGENGLWSYVVSGEIHPQPDYVFLTFTVPGMTSVTNIWAGENCIPEPTTLCLLGLALGLLRKRRA